MAEKHKMSLNIDAYLVRKIKVKSAMSNKTITEEIEEALEKHTKDVNLDNIFNNKGGDDK